MLERAWPVARRKSCLCDRERVILPQTLSRVPRAANVFDINADIVFIDDCDSSSLDAGPRELSQSHSSFKTPDTDRGVNPIIIAPLPLEAFQNMPVITCEDKD